MLVSIPFSTDQYPGMLTEQLIDWIKIYVNLVGNYADEIFTRFKEEALTHLIRLRRELHRRGRAILIVRDQHTHLWVITDRTNLTVAKSADGVVAWLIIADFHGVVWRGDNVEEAKAVLVRMKQQLHDPKVVTTAYNIGELHDS